MQSSHHNVAGEYVLLVMYASVWSRRFGQWRGNLPFPTASWGRVAGANIGYLGSGGSWIEWNLADATQRDDTISDVESAIRELAIPYFELFEDRARLVAALTHRVLAGLDPHNAVELLLWLGEHEAATMQVRAAINANAGMAAIYREEVQRIDRDGLGRFWVQRSSLGKALAYIVRPHNLVV